MHMCTEAISFIASKRPQVQPNDFFFLQLEMYERCDYEWDPVKVGYSHCFFFRDMFGFFPSRLADMWLFFFPPGFIFYMHL
jgi:hypothetical protein